MYESAAIPILGIICLLLFARWIDRLDTAYESRLRSTQSVLKSVYTTSNLIADLQQLEATHGPLPVCIGDSMYEQARAPTVVETGGFDGSAFKRHNIKTTKGQVVMLYDRPYACSD